MCLMCRVTFNVEANPEEVSWQPATHEARLMFLFCVRNWWCSSGCVLGTTGASELLSLVNALARHVVGPQDSSCDNTC
jgi:hypothetical protein